MGSLHSSTPPILRNVVALNEELRLKRPLENQIKIVTGTWVATPRTHTILQMTPTMPW